MAALKPGIRQPDHVVGKARHDAESRGVARELNEQRPEIAHRRRGQANQAEAHRERRDNMHIALANSLIYCELGVQRHDERKSLQRRRHCENPAKCAAEPAQGRQKRRERDHLRLLLGLESGSGRQLQGDAQDVRHIRFAGLQSGLEDRQHPTGLGTVALIGKGIEIHLHLLARFDMPHRGGAREKPCPQGLVLRDDIKQHVAGLQLVPRFGLNRGDHAASGRENARRALGLNTRFLP